MADSGFTVEAELREKGISLRTTSFLESDRVQSTAPEVTSTRRIAEAIIHVERSMERITEFLILQGEVDISILHVLHQGFRVCSFLTNFQRPIVRDVLYVD